MSEFGKDINVHSRKGVFIPDITVEMLRNASLEGVEDLMASGEMEDISLPSAQPERMGRWIRDVTYYPLYHCNQCGEKTDNTIMGIPRYKYCPNCGARMVKQGEEHD